MVVIVLAVNIFLAKPALDSLLFALGPGGRPDA